MFIKITIITITLAALSFDMLAQKHESDIKIIAKSKSAGVWLRWAPTVPAVWLSGNKHGYTIERFTLLPNGELENAAGVQLTPVPLKPYSQQEMAQLSAQVKELDVLAELIYNNDNPRGSDDPNSLLARNKDLENKFGIALLVCDLSLKVAQAAGLFFEDKTAITGKRYIYRVSVAMPSPGQPVKPGVIVTDVTEEKPLATIPDLAGDFRDRTVSLRWSTLLHYEVFSSYFIEKSEDGNHFKRLSDLPYIHMSEKEQSETAFFVDSLETNNKVYYYRIKGVTPFGEIGPPSNVVSGSGIENLSGFVVIREGKVFDNKAAKIIWEFPHGLEEKIFGFVIKRAKKADGPYQDASGRVLNKGVREFTDDTPFQNSYYVVCAVDKNLQELAESFPFLVHLEDNTPPAVPLDLSGVIDKQGVVRLAWKNCTDKDLMGYRIFRANHIKEEFVEVSKTFALQSSFTDTINIRVLNKQIHYRIVSVDDNYNNSEFSEILTLHRPDVIPPVAAVFTKAEVNQGTIVLQWTNSTSSDVAKIELTRYDKEDDLWRVLQTWNASARGENFTEASLTPGRTYQYRILTYDSSGNISSGYSPQLFFETGFRNELSEIKASIDRDARQIVFQWQNKTEVRACAVYRKRDNGPLVLYKTLEGNVDKFIDNNVSINSRYVYRFQLTYVGGLKSQLSREISVVY